VSRLQLYVTREVLNAFVPAFLALLFIMVLGLYLQLLHEGLDLVRLRGLTLPVITYSVPWVLPSAFLTAIVIAFGRLAADNEVVAMQSAGVHLLHIMLPVYAAAVLVSGVAGYFYFNALPRAGQRMQLLKFEAIKEVLLDKVALSAGKQIWFRPCAIYYSGFEDGHMADLLIVETKGGSAQTIIRARRGRIQPSAKGPAFMELALDDCAVTQLGEGEFGGRGTWKAKGISLPVRVASDPQAVASKVKHLTLGGMLKRRAELLRAVARHPRRFRDPDEVVHKARQRIDEIDIQRAQLRAVLKDRLSEVESIEEKRRNLDALIARQIEERREAQAALGTLKGELVACMEEMKRVEHPPEGAEPDYARLAELRARVRELSARRDAEEARLREAEADIREARRRQRRGETAAARIKREVEALRAELDAIEQKRRQLWALVEMARAQASLRELDVRFHQRLALAAAVVVFAVLGIPLGITTRRRSFLVAFGIGFAIMLLLFYPALIVGQIAAKSGLVPVVPAMWSGNVMTFLIGLALTANVLRK